MINQRLTQDDGSFCVDGVEPGHGRLLTNLGHLFEVRRLIALHSTIGQRCLQPALCRRDPFLLDADATLVLGSSLMVWSGYRFVQAAAEAGKPIAAVNLGATRADDLFEFKVTQSCSSALSFVLDAAAA